MPVVEIDNRLCFVRLDLSPDELPGLLASHAAAYPGAREIEQLGSALKAAGFPPAEALGFLRSVLIWGRGQRLKRRLEQVTGEQVSAALEEGCNLAQAGSAAEGVDRIRLLHGLGQSFSSKLLRFLEPSRAVILDSVIRTSLGYPDSAAGYTEFLGDCQVILARVGVSDRLSRSESSRLRVCDIEAAVFAKIQGY